MCICKYESYEKNYLVGKYGAISLFRVLDDFKEINTIT